LPLLVARVSTDHINLTVSPYNLALVADTANAGANFHVKPTFPNETISRIMGRKSMLLAGKRAARELRVFDSIYGVQALKECPALLIFVSGGEGQGVSPK